MIITYILFLNDKKHIFLSFNKIHRIARLRVFFLCWYEPILCIIKILDSLTEPTTKLTKNVNACLICVSAIFCTIETEDQSTSLHIRYGSNNNSKTYAECSGINFDFIFKIIWTYLLTFSTCISNNKHAEHISQF